MDETAVRRYHPPACTYDRRGAAGMNGRVRRNGEGADWRDICVITLCNDGSTLNAFYIESTVAKPATANRPAVPAVRGMNKILFKKWVEDVFLSKVLPKSILIMDNLNSHKDSESIKLITDAGHTVLYMSTYSAKFLSPCDNTFFKTFKNILRQKNFPRTHRDLENHCQQAKDEVAPLEIRKFFKHCGLPFIGKI